MSSVRVNAFHNTVVGHNAFPFIEDVTANCVHALNEWLELSSCLNS